MAPVEIKSCVDEEGWLTYMVAGGSKTRPVCYPDVYRYESGCCGSSSMPSSQEAFTSLLQHPDGLAVVVSDRKAKEESCRYGTENASPALAVAMLCDAAGLMPQATKVICCTLGEKNVRRHVWNGHDTVFCEIGHTAQKAREVAETAIAAGARLISAPEGWGESLVRLDAWLRRRAECVATGPTRESCMIDLSEIPVLFEPTDEVLKIACLQKNDEMLAQRKPAVSKLRQTFKPFDAPMQRLAGALSFGLLKPDDVKNSPNNEVPAWKRKLLEPSMSPEVHYRTDGTSDRLAVSIIACATLWQAVFDKYVIAPVPAIKRNKHLNEEEYDVAIEGWKRVGTALGVEDALRAVIEDGVAIEDVLSLI